MKPRVLLRGILLIGSLVAFGYLLEVTISGIVETLMRSMENLRTGKEPYRDDGDEDDISPAESD